MKTIKVLLDFNITKKIHSLYHSFFNNPPEGVEYKKSEFALINNKSYSVLGKTRKILIKIFPFIGKLEKNAIKLLRKESDADLIHFTFHLGETNKKCVVDYEHVYTFIKIKDKNNQKIKQKIIKKLNKGNIKYLMPINQESLKSFELFFGKNIKIPQEIIYPTIFIPEKFREPVKKENKVIFISTSNIINDEVFLIKGGLETIIAFERLSKRYPKYEFIILGKIPDYLKKRYPKNMIIKDSVSREEMWGLFNKSQIFVQPTYQAPAMAFIEAMFFKLPIITYNCWANDEYVDKSNGILINPEKINNIDEYNVPEYTEEITNKIRKNSDRNSKKIERAIEKLIKDKKLRERLGNDGLKRVLTGKFSMDKRNEKLRKVYEEALK